MISSCRSPLALSVLFDCPSSPDISSTLSPEPLNKFTIATPPPISAPTETTAAAIIAINFPDMPVATAAPVAVVAPDNVPVAVPDSSPVAVPDSSPVAVPDKVPVVVAIVADATAPSAYPLYRSSRTGTAPRLYSLVPCVFSMCSTSSFMAFLA